MRELYKLHGSVCAACGYQALPLLPAVRPTPCRSLDLGDGKPPCYLYHKLCYMTAYHLMRHKDKQQEGMVASYRTQSSIPRVHHRWHILYGRRGWAIPVYSDRPRPPMTIEGPQEEDRLHRIRTLSHVCGARRARPRCTHCFRGRRCTFAPASGSKAMAQRPACIAMALFQSSVWSMRISCGFTFVLASHR